MYEFVNKHKGNKKVPKKDLIDLLGNNLKTIIRETEKLKQIDDKNDKQNVDTIVNKVLKDFFDEISTTDDTIQVNNDSEESNEDIQVLSQEVIPTQIEDQKDNEIKLISDRLIRIESALNLKPFFDRKNQKPRKSKNETQEEDNHLRNNYNPKKRFKSRVFHPNRRPNNYENWETSANVVSERHNRWPQRSQWRQSDGWRPRNGWQHQNQWQLPDKWQHKNQWQYRKQWISPYNQWLEPSAGYWKQVNDFVVQPVSQPNDNINQNFSQMPNTSNFLGQTYPQVLRNSTQA